MDIILQRLDEIHTTLEVPSDHFRGELLAERDALIDQLGESYLTATPRRRGAVRRFVKERHRLIIACEDRVTWHAYRLQASGDIRHLRLGLAAASIVALGIDPRDFGFAIGHLSRAAVRAGIDPRPHFREAANLSPRRRSLLAPYGQPGP